MIGSKPSSCSTCPLLKAPGPVFGEGNPATTKLIYIAQNPGLQEVSAQPMRPLIGPSGRVFNRQLFEAGLRRDELFITNQVKCLTPNNRPPSEQEVQCCRPLLEAEIKRCRADTVLLSGDLAFKSNIGFYSTLSPAYRPRTRSNEPVGVMTRMGCVEQREGRKWIGTIHPAFIMRMPEWRTAAVDHLRKASILSGLEVPLPRIIEHPSDKQILELVDYINLVSLEFADDVETFQTEDVEEDDYVGADYKMDICGIGAKPYEALVCDVDQVHLLAPAFANEAAIRYEHNGEYERYHLEKIFGANGMRTRCFDTMLGTHYIRSYAPKKLKPFCVSQYTNLPYFNRDLGKLDRRLYNGMDVVSTFLAAKEEQRQLAEWKLTDVFAEFGQPLLPILEEWRRIGIRIDLRRALFFKKITEEKIAKAAALIAKLTGPFFNWNSPKQVASLLYDTYKLPRQYHGRGAEQRLTTDYEARKSLRKWIEIGGEMRLAQYKSAYYILQLLDFISGEEKKLEYLGRISPDGRLHIYFKAHGTVFFRLSSKPNMQNWPIYDISAWGGARRDADGADPFALDKEEERRGDLDAPELTEQLGSLRSIVIPDHEDDLLLTCDFEQLQLWIYATQFNVKWLLNIFQSHEYIYGVIYEKLHNEPFFEPGKPKTKEFRLPTISQKKLRRVKAVPLGFLKGRSAATVAAEYGWTLEEAEKLRKWWYGLNPELLQAYSKGEYEMRQKGFIRQCFGQITHFPNQKVSEVFDSYAQSPEAFVLIGSITRISDELKRRGYKNTRIMLSVHDSLTLNVGGARVNPSNMVEVYEEVIAPILNRAVPQLNGFRFRHEAEVGTRWDWDTMSYAKWKKTNGYGDARTAGEDNTARA